MTQQDKFELAKRLLLDFKAYVVWVHELAQNVEYDMTPSHIKICDTLQKYADGKNEKRNLMINCPPGTGKSLLLQYFITWCFARNKNNMFCYVAYGERLIKKLSRDSRNLMMMPEWEELFGKEMDPNDKSVLNYHLISGGVRSGLTAGTVSSALLGLDAGVPGVEGFSGGLLMDDANSTSVLTSVHEQIELPDVYQRKLATRRRTPTTPTIATQQRICENDFSGWILKNEPEDWEFLIIPALDENGESFYPKRYPKEELEKLQKQNPYMFAAMYQQAPIENYGAYFHEEWIRTYRANPDDFSKIFITTDFGFTTTGDKSVFCCWGLAKDNNLYLLRSLQGKWESPDAKKYFVDFFRRCNSAYRQCRRVYIENTLSGLGFIQEMRRECPQMAIIPLKRGAKKNKQNRAESAMTWLEAGRVYFREADPNFVPLRAELLAYNPADKNPKDEWCFVAGTKIMTAFGEKPIEKIKVGDILWTPLGYTRVLKTDKKTKPVITRHWLTGTADHKVWNPLHFEFDCLGDVCYFEPRLIQRSIRWAILKSYSMANGTNITKRQDITSCMTRTTRNAMGKCYTGLFGSFIQERKYLQGILFIILTAIGVTTTIITLCVLRLLSMLRCTAGLKNSGQEPKPTQKRLKTSLTKRGHTTKAQKAEQKPVNILRRIWIKFAKHVRASCAEKHLNTATQPMRTTEKSATNVKTAGNIKQNAEVYAIKTGNGVYVANSVLVSNCDNIGDACEIAFNQKTSSIFV